MKKITQATLPVICLLRLMDSDVPCVGKVYYKMFQLKNALLEVPGLTRVQKRQITHDLEAGAYTRPLFCSTRAVIGHQSQIQASTSQPNLRRFCR